MRAPFMAGNDISKIEIVDHKKRTHSIMNSPCSGAKNYNENFDTLSGVSPHARQSDRKNIQVG